MKYWIFALLLIVSACSNNQPGKNNHTDDNSARDSDFGWTVVVPPIGTALPDEAKSALEESRRLARIKHFLNGFNIEFDTLSGVFNYKMPNFNNNDHVIEYQIFGKPRSEDVGDNHYFTLGLDSIRVTSPFIQNIILPHYGCGMYLYLNGKYEVNNGYVINCDINHDGYLDIGVYDMSLSGAGYNSTFDYYIYNRKKRQFEFSEDFSLPNLKYNEEDSTYLSAGYGSGGGMIYRKTKYKLINNHLIPIYFEDQDFNSKLNKLIRKSYKIADYVADTTDAQ